jgi:hypothetical protein
MEQVLCHCAEARYERDNSEVVQTKLGIHDCEYILKRNALIPRAERTADAIAGRRGLVATDDVLWSRSFHRAMNALVKENGVVK